MNTDSKDKIVSGDGSRLATAEQRLRQLGLKLPAPPEPFGIYAEAVQTGNLLFLTGCFQLKAARRNSSGASVRSSTCEAGHGRLAWRPSTASPSRGQHLGSLDKVTRIVRLGVAVATSGDVRDQPKVADGASELLQDVFGKDKNPSRLVYGVASLPLGVPVELELIFEVSA